MSIEALERIYNRLVIVSELERPNSLQKLTSNPFLTQIPPTMPKFYCVNPEKIQDGQIVEIGTSAVKCKWDITVYSLHRAVDPYGEIELKPPPAENIAHLGTSVPISIGSGAPPPVDLESVPGFDFDEFMDWVEGNQMQDERHGLWGDNRSTMLFL
ncbi:hypothetical protein ABW20_dc0105214 [Dactylellina cionopaga]|nr:hypothetical protein ABW20_dc0105214 [Dactylellina cionopaga]